MHKNLLLTRNIIENIEAKFNRGELKWKLSSVGFRDLCRYNQEEENCMLTEEFIEEI